MLHRALLKNKIMSHATCQKIATLEFFHLKTKKWHLWFLVLKNRLTFFKNFFSKNKKIMLLPTHEPVLNPKFGVVISKTVTCSLWTDKPTCILLHTLLLVAITTLQVKLFGLFTFLVHSFFYKNHSFLDQSGGS